MAGSPPITTYLEYAGRPFASIWDLPLQLALVAYTIPLLVILLAHEAGHLLACRRHQIPHGWPFLLPAPMPLTGTLGVTLPTDLEATRSRCAIFDVGAWGPLAGFLVALPILALGVAWSVPARVRPTAALYHMPLVMQALVEWRFGPVDLVVHPLAWAGWLGCVFTSMNLLPFLRLDGGLIVMALAPASWLVASGLVLAGVVTVAAETLLSGGLTWAAVLVAMLIMAAALGLRPILISRDERLGWGRWALAAACLAVLVGTLSPIEVRR